MKKQTVFWLLWLVMVIFVIWFFAIVTARGATKPPQLPGKKKPLKPAAVQQGAGAMMLISESIIPPIVWRTNWIAWDYTNLTTITNFKVYRGPSIGVYTNTALAGKVLSNRFVYQKNTINFVSVTALGTNGFESDHSNEIRVPPPHKSNIVVTVTCMNGGTNIAYSPSLNGPWTKLNTTNWTTTNPPIPRYLRGIGKTNNTLKISAYRY